MVFLSIWLVIGFIMVMFFTIEGRYTDGIWLSGSPGCPRSLAVIIWMVLLSVFLLLGPIGVAVFAYKYFSDKEQK